MGKALVAIVFIAIGMPLQRAEAGIRPGGRPPFLCATRKEAKKRAPQSAAPCGAHLRRGVCGVRRVTHFAAAQLRSDKRGESDDEACAQRRACHPANTPPQALPEGGLKTANHAGHRCARPRVRSARRLRHPGRAQRWPEGLLGHSHPFWLRRGAQGAGWRVCRRTHPLRDLTRRGCSSAARQRVASSTAHPTNEHRRLPAAKRRDADCRVAFLLGTFLWRSKEKYLARRGESRPPPSAKAQSTLQTQ